MTHTRNTTGVRTATRIPLTILAALVASVGSAAIIPVSPVGGEVVAFVPDAQKTVMAPPTLADRIALFREDREKGGKVIRNDKFWRKAKPVVLTWRVTEGEIGPWKVEVGTDPSLECADIRYVGTKNDTKNDDFMFHSPRRFGHSGSEKSCRRMVPPFCRDCATSRPSVRGIPPPSNLRKSQ